MFVPMSHASSSYNPPSGPSPPPPRRNVAAGRRLAPLPPSLRTGPHHQVSSTRPARHPSPSSSSSSSFSTAAGARSSSKQRQDGQCRLPSVSQVGHPTPHRAPSASPKRAITAASVRRLFAGTAPASRGSASGSSAGEVMPDYNREARPLSGEPRRTPGLAATRSPTPQRRGGAMDVASKPSAVASSTVPQGRPKPRALALQRSGGGILGNRPTHRSESRVFGTAAIHRALSRQPAQPERNGQRHTSSDTSLSIAANDAAAACSAPALPGAGCPSSSAQQEEQPQNGASIDLPYVLHDMDELFFTDMQNWRTEEELPGLVWSLLEGVSLEAPYTSHLWAQAYVSPADLLPAPKAKASALPDMFVHLESQQRTNGFYACVRCGTPICEPSHQVMPASFSLRGIAVFDALHMNGVELRVCTPTVKSGAPTQSRGRRSSSPSFPAAKSNGRVEAAPELDVAAGGLRFLVHCRHCNGCLGVMRLGEATRAPSADASRPRVVATTPAAAPATALFCANSVCLEYMPYRTRARLDQSIMNSTGGDSEAGSSGRGGGAASMFGRASAAEHAQSGVTLRSLLGPQHGAAAWGFEGAIDVDYREKQGVISNAGGAAGLDASFDALLEGLNLCGDLTPMSSSVCSDG